MPFMKTFGNPFRTQFVTLQDDFRVGKMIASLNHTQPLAQSFRSAHCMPSAGARNPLLTISFVKVNKGRQDNHMQKSEYIPMTLVSPVTGTVRYPVMQSLQCLKRFQFCLLSRT